MNPKFKVVNGVNTRYFEKGNGRPVVLIHGGDIGARSYYDAYCWSMNLDGLSENCQVYAPDRLAMGHTDNPKSNDDYRVGSIVKHVRDFILSVGIKKTSVVGHSRGGLIATCVALQYPELVNSLVIVDSGTLADDPSTRRTFYDDLEKTLPPTDTMESVQREPVANSYSRQHITPDFVRDLYEVANLPKTIKVRQKMNAGTRDLLRTDFNRVREETKEQIRAGRLTKPTLVIWGMNDPSAPVTMAMPLFQLISTHVPKSELHIFNHAGHYVFRDQAEAFNNVVASFTSRF